MRKRFSWVAFFLGGAFAVALLLLGAIWSTESRRLATERSRAAAWWYVPEPKLASDSCAAFLGGQLTNVHVDADDAVGGGVSVKITGSSMETMTFHLSVDDAMRVADLIRGVAQWRAMQLSEQDGGPWL
jgi:hypothetical protein